MNKITRLIFVVYVFVSACTCLVGCKRKVEIKKPVGQKSDLASVVVEEEGPALTRLEDDGSWIATASSVEKGLTPDLAMDQDMSTRWSSEFSNDQWWQVDFGQIQTLCNIVVHWEDAFAAAYKVLVSSDGETWDTILDEQKGRAGARLLQFDARPARFVRIECERRGTEWGFSIFEVDFNVPAPPRMKTTASSGTGDYAPLFAVDGDMGTRWSSNFGDSEWWQVEFEKSRTLTGMKISWETAFTEKYEIAVSDDGKKWRTIYVVDEGDGQTDILFFAPVQTRFLRIVCNQRGTGWGNSIWEIEFFGDGMAIQASASSSASGRGPELAVDGLPNTSWESAGNGEQWLAIQLPQEMHIGGVELLWGAKYAVSYDVEWSDDGETWTRAFHESFGNGEKDYVFFSGVKAQHLRIFCRTSSAGDGYELARVELKSGEEQATPLREYQARARDAEKGRYPMWLTRQQEFWTVVGLPEDSQESLLGETGTFEPFKGAFSVQPFVLVNNDIVSWANVELSQSLVKNYLPLPSVDWTAKDWSMNIAALSFGRPGAAFTAVRYRLSNSGDAPIQGSLVLAVRPIQLNPVWQHGGMSRIEFAECFANAEPPMVRMNGRTGLLLPTAPARMGVSSLGEGEINDYLNQGRFPEIARAMDSEGKIGVAVQYDLLVPAGEARDVVVIYPLHEGFEVSPAWQADPSDAFEKKLGESVAAWEKLLDDVVIDIPEARLIQTMKSNLGYVLINRDAPWYKPGSRNYNHSWMRDGALTGVAALRMGKSDTVKAFIENFSQFVNDDGWVPYIIMENGQPIGYNPNKDGGEGHEFDSQGQFVFIVRQYYDFTQDDSLVRSVYPAVLRALEYGREIRRRRLTDQYKDTVYWGILPPSNSHEGYFPAKHSYWDDFWMLRGLKDGAYLAEQMGDPEAAAWIRAEEKELRECLLSSIMAVIKRDNIAYIPGCAELGDEDPTSTSIAIMACDETDYLPQPYLAQTFDRYQDRISKRHAGTADTFTPYEARNADVFIRVGQRDRALAMFRHFMKDSMRPHNWNHMAEVVHATPRAPSYIGDMPHTWVGSDYINAVRSIFSYVHDDALVLAAGIDPAWLDTGVTVENLPTQFGRIAYRMKRADEGYVFMAAGDVNPPNGFVLPVPQELRSLQVTVNGVPSETDNGLLRFTRLPAHIKFQP